MRTALVILLLTAVAQAGEALAIRGARVIPISGEEIEAGTVIVRDGRIEAVGKDLEIPWDARVVEGKGLVLTPGLVHPHSQGGLDRANERMPVTPFVSVVDSIDPDSTFFEDALRQGITTLLIAPGDETVIGGLAAIVHPAGRYVDEMLVVRDAGMKIAVSPRRGVSRMAQMAELRRALDGFVRAREDLDRAIEKAKKEGKDAPEPSSQQDAIFRVLRGEIPAIFACDRSMDVWAATRLMDEYGLTGMVVTGRECREAAALAAGRNLPVVLPSPLEYWDREPGSEEPVRRFVAGPFREAGARFAPTTGGGGVADGLLWYQAATLVKNGVPRADALRAVTLGAADVIGLADRIGTIEPGKEADLVLWTGDPLSVDSWVSKVIITGRVVYEREKDERLKEIGGGGDE